MGQDGEDRKGGGADVTSNGQQPQPSGERAAYPGAPPSAPTFDKMRKPGSSKPKALATIPTARKKPAISSVEARAAKSANET